MNSRSESIKTVNIPQANEKVRFDFYPFIPSGEDFLVTSFTLDDGTRFVLSIRMVGQFWRARRHRTWQQQLLQIVEEWRVVFGEEGYGRSVLSGTTSSTNTMRVIFDSFGHVVVDDQGYVLDVDTTTSDISGYQNVFSARFQVRQSKLTLLLTLATVQRGRIVTEKGKTLGQAFLTRLW